MRHYAFKPELVAQLLELYSFEVPEQTTKPGALHNVWWSINFHDAQFGYRLEIQWDKANDELFDSCTATVYLEGKRLKTTTANDYVRAIAHLIPNL